MLYVWAESFDCFRNFTMMISFQGDQLWRLDGNMVMEPGYPKPLSSEFPGVTGSISAVLAVPATRTRPEMVFFFKQGERDEHTTVPNLSFLKLAIITSLIEWRRTNRWFTDMTFSNASCFLSRRHHPEVHPSIIRQCSVLHRESKKPSKETLSWPGWLVNKTYSHVEPFTGNISLLLR